MKTIHFDGVPSRSITVSDMGYEEIVALVTAHRRCHKNGCVYTEDNPLVGINLCLGCFLQEHQGLTYSGSYREPDEFGRQTYAFLDTEGCVDLSTADYSDRPTRNISATLEHWGFTVPEQYSHSRHGDYRLWPLNWRIYGNLQTASVLVGENRYDSKYTATFLAYKGGAYKELTKRDPETKLLLQKAREVIESTKDAQGRYHIGAYPTTWLSDTLLYEVISEMESAVYDVQVKIRRNGKSDGQAAETQEEVTA